jgi:hypothetical protein
MGRLLEVGVSIIPPKMLMLILHSQHHTMHACNCAGLQLAPLKGKLNTGESEKKEEKKSGPTGDRKKQKLLLVSHRTDPHT